MQPITNLVALATIFFAVAKASPQNHYIYSVPNSNHPVACANPCASTDPNCDNGCLMASSTTVAAVSISTIWQYAATSILMTAQASTTPSQKVYDIPSSAKTTAQASTTPSTTPKVYDVPSSTHTSAQISSTPTATKPCTTHMTNQASTTPTTQRVYEVPSSVINIGLVSTSTSTTSTPNSYFVPSSVKASTTPSSTNTTAQISSTPMTTKPCSSHTTKQVSTTPTTSSSQRVYEVPSSILLVSTLSTPSSSAKSSTAALSTTPSTTPCTTSTTVQISTTPSTSRTPPCTTSTPISLSSTNARGSTFYDVTVFPSETSTIAAVSLNTTVMMSITSNVPFPYTMASSRTMTSAANFATTPPAVANNPSLNGSILYSGVERVSPQGSIFALLAVIFGTIALI
ncbi:hypothetical protein HDU76_011658 [Blyttiomyces sp. JEL0837]|nr:hypothetical protein HDU76_011658 [Blyttiomyces sp. JEL0837]